MFRNPLLRVALVASSMLLATPALAQEAPETAPQPDPSMPPIPADELNRGTPIRSVEGFQAAADRRDFVRAAEFLDLRNLRGEAGDIAGPVLAEMLSIIASRAEWKELGVPIDDPRGRLDDGLPDYRDLIGVVEHDDEEVRLYMQRVPRGDGEFIWKVSNATVTLIPALYETYGYSRLVEDIRRQLPDWSFLGFELFKWIIVLAVGAVTYVTVLLFALLLRRIPGKPESGPRKLVFRFLALPFGLWATAMAMNMMAESLGRSQTAATLGQYSPLPHLITTWFIFAAINLWQTLYAQFLEGRGREGSEVLIRPAANALKLIVFIAALLTYMNDLGINITTLLAGLGVGGVAVALALQKPMEDVFGAITLYSQQPIRVGDFCRVGSETGTIEEIGLRTTFIRTLANTRIAIPNSRLATEPIDNYSARQKILYRPTLRLRYDTNPEQVQSVLEGIREALEDHERVMMGHRVRFKDIGTDALLVEVFAYFDTTLWTEYLELAEEMNLRILEIVTRAGTSLSLPSSTMKIEQAAAIGTG
jgi:MscS family membrane protein